MLKNQKREKKKKQKTSPNLRKVKFFFERVYFNQFFILIKVTIKAANFLNELALLASDLILKLLLLRGSLVCFIFFAVFITCC